MHVPQTADKTRSVRIEDDYLLRGQGRFSDDVSLPGQGYAAFVRSPHAFARIASVDAEAARGMPGVVGVLTAADMDAANATNITIHPPVAGAKLYVPPRPPLAKDRVLHVGQAVAMVVADTPYQAIEAAENVVVEYEPLDAVTDLRAATEADAPLLWPEAPRNVALDWGGVEANTPDNIKAVDEIIRGATHVARLSLVNQRMSGVPMETRGATAGYDAGEDSYLLHVCSQGSGPLRGAIASVLGVQKVRVITQDVGGGFGIKAGLYPEYIAMLVGAKVLGRPVHWMSTRGEAFTSDNEARDSICDAELALDEKGKFLALRMRVVSNLGAYLAPPGALIQTTSMTRCLPGMYDIPRIDVQGRCVLTNTIPVSAYRGAGRPEANYFLERLVDKAAEVTGIDRVSLRKRNLVKPKAMPYRSAIGNVIDSGDFPAVVDHALKLADYDTYKQRKRESAKRGKLRGIGISCFLEHSGATPFETASVAFSETGDLQIGVGVASSGQGHRTVFAELAARRLGLDLNEVGMKAGDSDMGLAGGPAVGSRSAQSVGTALSRAIDVMLEKARKAAGSMLETSESDIEFSNGQFRIVGTDRSVSLREVARHAKARTGQDPALVPLDTTEKIDTGLTFPNGCHVAEVEVDPQTGEVAVVSYSAVDDSGVLLNRTIVEGQIQGGVAQGLGQALMEKTVYNDDGQIVTASFMDYAMPRAEDLPQIIFEDHPVPCTTNPLGVKGVGEAGTTGSLAAIVNAIMDAIPHEVADTLDMPVTPERLWRALQARSAT